MSTTIRIVSQIQRILTEIVLIFIHSPTRSIVYRLTLTYIQIKQLETPLFDIITLQIAINQCTAPHNV